MPTLKEDGYDLDIDAKSVRVFYRRLLMAGWTPREAGNLIASLMGLDITTKGWTVKELQAMLFLRAIEKTLEP